MKKMLRMKIFAFSILSVIVTAVICIGGYYYFFIDVLQKKMESGNLLTTQASELILHEFYVSLMILIPIVVAVICIEIAFFNRLGKDFAKSIDEMANSLAFDSENIYDEMKPVLQKIKEQRVKQQEVDKIKRQFTANVSHELKTPLTSIMGYAELIESGAARGEDVARFAKVVRNETQRLINLTSDIIKLSQLDDADDAPPVLTEKVNLYESAKNAVDALSMMAEKRNVSLYLQGESYTIKGCAGLIEDMIYNLCENAIRYNKNGGSVTVSVNFDGKNSILKVSDTGIGIPEKNQKRIYERFYRVDKSRSTSTGGTGLGLAIVKHIAEYHGAQLDLESKENLGTIITVKFAD